MKALGSHFLVEYYGCDSKILNNSAKIQKLMLGAASMSGATVLKSYFHKFLPHGVSGIVLITESHFSIHTWPEHEYAAVDIFTCGTGVDPSIAIERIKFGLNSTDARLQEIERGDVLKFKNKISEEAV